MVHAHFATDREDTIMYTILHLTKVVWQGDLPNQMQLFNDNFDYMLHHIPEYLLNERTIQDCYREQIKKSVALKDKYEKWEEKRKHDPQRNYYSLRRIVENHIVKTRTQLNNKKEEEMFEKQFATVKNTRNNNGGTALAATPKNNNLPFFFAHFHNSHSPHPRRLRGFLHHRRHFRLCLRSLHQVHRDS